MARHEVAAALASWGHPDAAKVAVLLTSEVVTNAVKHAGPFAEDELLHLVLDQTGDLVRVEVTDYGHTLPVAGDGSMDGPSGRGLLLVDAMATRWGVIPNDEGKIIWFEVSP